MKPFAACFTAFLLLIFCACEKDRFITSPDARVSVSADTLHFDTVFTSAGSVTQFLKITNNNDQKLLLSEVSLGGSGSSPFRINVDGVPGPLVKNIEIAANDSIYVFVSVSIRPDAASLPFVVQDSISIGFNGNRRQVQLQAWGQNAHFLRNRKITGNATWTNDLPYVILGGLQVDTNATLTIQKGCRIYFHADAPLLVDGSLKVYGEKYDSSRVYFRSDRLDDPYRDFPAGWPGIYFRTLSRDNILQYAVVQNAFQGLVAEQPSVNGNPKLTLQQCIIDNIYDAGIYGIGTSITATNCLISNCGAAKQSNGNITLALGGNYQFTHCTAVGISNNYVPHQHAVLGLYNYTVQNNTVFTGNLSATFTNCIFWGDSLQQGNEVVADKKGNASFSANFTNCLWRMKSYDPTLISTANMINIQGMGADTTLFLAIDRQKRIYNFRLKTGSPAIDRGVNTGLAIDLDGNPRPVNLPDLGCYEKQ